jgi:hypothetical protein
MSSTPYVLKLADPDHKLGAMYRVDTPQGERFDIAEIEPLPARSPIEWLWPGRIPYGTVTVIEGAAGSGKTRLAFDLAARMGSQSPWPDGAPNQYPAEDVLVVSRHEEAQPAVINRFAQGAAGDPRTLVRFRGFWTECAEPDQRGDRPVAFPFDIEALQFHLEMHASIRLVIIDPLSDFCATPRLLTETLHELQRVAKENEVAIIATVPAHCRVDREGRLKVTSRWPTDAARCVWSILADPDDPSRRLLAARRTNFCREPDGLAFRLADDGVAWEADSKVSPLDPAGYLTACQRALQELLRDEGLPATTVYRLGAEMGYTPKELRAAAKQVGARSARVGYAGAGHWMWVLRAEPPAEAAGVVCDFASQISRVEAMPPPSAEGGGVEADAQGPVFERDGRFEYLPLLPAVERPLAVTRVAPEESGEASLQKVESGGGGVETPNTDPAACPALAPLAAVVAPQAIAEPRDAGAARECRVDPMPCRARPLSKRKAKRARRNLARRRAAEFGKTGIGVRGAPDGVFAGQGL